MAVPDISNRGCCIWAVEIQINISHGATVSQYSSIISPVKFMKSQTVSINVELAAMIAPFDIIRINLFVVV